MMKVSLKEDHTVSGADWCVTLTVIDGERRRLGIRRIDEETTPTTNRPYLPALSTAAAHGASLRELRDILDQLIKETEA